MPLKSALTKYSLWRGNLGKIILVFFASMVIIHIIVLGVLTQKNKHNAFRLNYDLMARQVTDLVYTIQQAKPDKLESTVNALAVPNIKVDLDKNPDYSMMLNIKAPPWSILHNILKENSNHITLSLYLNNKRWVNISAAVVRSAWEPEFFLFLLESLIVVTILISMWSINRFTEPLKKFRAAAENLGVDINPKPVAEYGPSVVRDTAQAINKMQERIRDLLSSRTQMLGALSHDLRTPITRLKLRSQFIEDQELQQKINSDLDQIETMINETLDYVREEVRHDNKIKIDLKSLLAAICDDYSDTGAKVKFKCKLEQAPFIGSQTALRRALTNLIDNAIKYAGTAEIELTQHKKQFVINVIDHGPGIPTDMKAKVFEPFFRQESSRSRDTGGTGLGLAVVQDVIRMHSGKIELKDVKPHGLLVQITL